MNPIAQGLALGYSAQKMLGFLSKAFPALAPKINQAKSQGHSIEQILGFISKTMETDYPKGMSQPEIHAANSKKQETLTKHGLTALGGLAGSMALKHALPNNIAQMFGGGNSPNQPANAQVPQQNTMQAQGTGQGLNSPTGNVAGQQNVANTQTQPQGINQSQQPPIQNVNNVTSVTQPQQTPQPEQIINPNEYLEKLGIKDKVDDLLKRGNSPEQTAAVLGMKGGMGKVRGEIDPELLANIDAYSKLPHSVPEEKTENVPIAKNETVSTPHGIGEVKEIRNGKAIVEVNGKKHQIDEEELEAAPLPEKDLAALYDELIEGIESETGEDVSRMVQWAGYNPETNTLQFLPHTGKLYKYGNISPEDAALLTDILSTRKTSGENFIGAWKAGSKSPIGAALSKLIRKLQTERGGKGNEYEETHEPIYSAYEPAVQAKKKKKKK